MLSIEIRLDGESGEIEIWVMNPDRISQHGFGSFLENYDPAEVGITDEARAVLIALPYRSGLMEMEFFNHPVIGYCSRRADLESVSVHGDVSRDLISRFTRVE